MHRLLMPLVCLVAGVALGYFVSEAQHGGMPPLLGMPSAAQASPASASSMGGGTALPDAEKTGKEKSKDKDKDAKGDKTDALAAALDELTSEFSAKRARTQFEGLSFDEIQWALRYLAGKKGEDSASAVRAELMRAWAKSDPQAAWKAALGLADEDSRSYCLGAVAGELAKTNPDAAIKMAMSLGMNSDRSDVLRSIFSDWGKVNLSAAVAYWNSHPDLPADNYAINGAIYEVASKNPQQAAQQAALIGNSNARQSAMGSALRSWYKKDPAAAWDWVQKLTDPNMRDEALSSLLQQGVIKDPQEAIQKLDLISSPEARRDALRNLIYNWMRKDPAAAMEYVASRDSISKDENLYWSIGNALENLTPTEQGTMLARLPEGEMKNRVLNNMAQNYIYSGNYSQAVTMLNELPDSRDRDYSLHNLGQRWGKKDPSGAANWLNAQPDSTDRDLAVAGYVAAIAGNDPKAALQWAKSIPDESIQKTAYRNLANRWMAADPAAAQKWLTTAPLLSDSDKKAIIADAAKNSTSTHLPQVKDRR